MAEIDLIEKRLRCLSLADMRSHSSKTASQFALELFEVAASKERVGLLTDAVEFYRMAYKLDDKVDLKYRKKIFEDLPPLEKRKDGIPKVDHRFKKLDLSKIRVRKTLASYKNCQFEPLDESLSPVLAISVLPDEILMKIMKILLLGDSPSWFNFSMSCKKCAYLGLYDGTIWRLLARIVYPHQVYQKGNNRDYRVYIRKQWGRNYLKMLNERPFIKYRGVYISTVILQKEGGRGELSSAWTAPFRIITYYRYLRFYEDGRCLKLLTILEPKKVIPRFKQNWRGLIKADQVDENTIGKEWQRVYEGAFTINLQGDLVIESDGAYPDWTFTDKLKIVNGGRYSRHHKLMWLDMGYKNKHGEPGSFSLEGEKPYVFNRDK
ncbi:hypothetical protein FOA43_002166 [Brettanomyces nanus]|uniref:F-box protein Hrt3/FBXO9 C-terminal domain-containing protein n=1 Tax=Eeniella nana TaxID=13502 RepID=A0A875RPB4_EENNA|nr:uncharacterized protein FOA43_002166 [Brettanomyces nanus]QPG74830.1 hypothetical protein FOA43_002166 [Brettanomyces nanus]